MTLSEFINQHTGYYVDKLGRNSPTKTGLEYSGECVSIVFRYLKVFGDGYTANAYGNAKDYVNLTNSTKPKTPQDGDLIVYPNISPPYGHIGIYYKGKVFNQNPHKARLDPIGLYGSYVIVRPKLKQTLEVVKAPAIPKIGRYQTTDNLNIRTGAGTKLPRALVKNVTKNAQANVVNKSPNAYAVLKTGTNVDVSKFIWNADDKMYWAKIPSGFVSYNYLKKV